MFWGKMGENVTKTEKYHAFWGKITIIKIMEFLLKSRKFRKLLLITVILQQIHSKWCENGPK